MQIANDADSVYEIMENILSLASECAYDTKFDFIGSFISLVGHVSSNDPIHRLNLHNQDLFLSSNV